MFVNFFSTLYLLSLYFLPKSSVQVEVDMWIPVKVQMKVYHDDTPSKVLDRVFRDRGIPGESVF